MTLFKQIAVIVSTGVLVLLVLTSLDNFQRTSNFLESQMQTSAKDVATTLGIAISTTNSGNDKAALEAYFNAMFDSGYYSRIRLVKADNSIIHMKERILSVDGIPDWFIQLVPLKSAIGKAHVRQGWVTLGTLEVTAHPALAYAELYENVKRSLAWFALLFFIILCILWFDLHILLRPLTRIKDQAQAIHENRFIKQTKIPKTAELRSVVIAMNHMIDKVQQIFNDQEKTLARCQTLIYTDELTGLANRKYLLSQLGDLTAEESTFNGNIVILKLHNLTEVSEQHGYKKADLCIDALVSIFNKRASVNPDEKFARMSEDEFALIAPVDKALTTQTVQEIFDAFKNDLSEEMLEIFLVAGSAPVQGGAEIGTVLAQLDMALSQAMVIGPYAYKHADATKLILPQGKIEWRLWFKDKLANNGFYLVGQPVLNRDQEIIQRELFIRVNDQKGQVVPAGIFMPMAQVLGYDLEVDRMVFQLLDKLVATADKLATTADQKVSYALNLSSSFFQRADALDDFTVLLDHFQKHGQILCVEASHQTYMKSPQMFKQIAEAVKSRGHRFGIDHLDLNISMDTLQAIQPAYVKVSARLLDDLSQNKASGAYQALHTLTSALDIQTIAVGVDKAELLETLLNLGINGMQGNFLAEPEVLE
jgi:EAL domain-containing protein (putative c-di-GMP-specific phosphodiesterase class I)/GGDEF domain-containing protein